MRQRLVPYRQGMARALQQALAEAGGAGAPPSATARLRALLVEALDQGADELGRKRSGYDDPVAIALADGLVAAAPVPAALRADAEAATPRAWSVVAALVAAMVDASGLPEPTRPQDLALRAGALDGHLVLVLPGDDPEFAALSFDERVTGIDRLRAGAHVVPPAVLGDLGELREPIGAGHPLRVAEAVARLGGDPVDPDSADRLEDVLDVVLGAEAGHARPHEDPDPARRVARRILQRLDGMGKWGGYHTDITHLPRGFAGNDRALAVEVGKALLAAGLLSEKPSVGQRHVYLNPRRAGEIHRFVESGEAPAGLKLPVA